MLASMKKKRLTSTASVAANKGLLNEPGENNCFLNSAIQVLWHLDVFRRSFRLLSGHACMGASCIFCALKEIFDQFEYSKDHALPPNVLRSALAESFQQQNRFQLGLMDDAAECFENILNRIHIHIGNTVHEDVCTAPHCIPHQKFGLTLVQHSVCACGATSEPLPFIEMVHYVSATALCAENEATSKRYGPSGVSQMFGRLIRIAGSWGDMRSCPSECGQKVEMRKVLMNCPDVVSIGIVWDSEEPDVKQIVDLVNALGTTLRLTDLFHTVVDERASHLEMYLVGMVCYYGKHYSTFFFHTKLRKWVYFDDAQVSEVGKRWSNVISKCIKGHHQPLLLLYANPNASPVTVTTAPKHTTLLPGYSNQHLIEPLLEIPETNSLASEGTDGSVIDDESSETESMQASNDYPHRWSAEMKYHHGHSQEARPPASVSRRQSTKSDKGRPSYTPERSNERVAKHKKRHSHEIRQFADMKIDDRHEEARKPEESRSRRAAYQWHMTDEQSKSSRNSKMGNYVEPQPANWTQYKPYSQKSQQALTSVKTEGNRRHVKSSPDRNLYSVKTVDSKGMAAFCVTSNPHAHNDHANSPNPSARPKHSDQHVSIGRRSPPSSRRSSHSSQSSHSSLGRSSHKSGSSVNSAAKSGYSSGSHHQPSVPPDFDEDLLHAAAQTQSTTNCLLPIVLPAPAPSANRPSLPPKPPFLSRPLNQNVNNKIPLGGQAVEIPKQISESPKANLASKLPGSESLSTLNAEPSSGNTDRCISLFLDADELLERSRAADARMDYALALQLCLEATKTIERILMTENLSEKFLVKARIKHGDCVNKSRILHRRKNIRLKSQGKDSKERSSKPEADRHMTSSSNELLKPTMRAPTLANRSNASSPTATRKKTPVIKTSSKDKCIDDDKLDDEKFLKHLQENESNDHLIDFNKPGMTKFQHVVQNMFKRQNDYKDTKTRHQTVLSPEKKGNPVMSSYKKSNSEVLSHKKSNSMSSSDGNSNNSNNVQAQVDPRLSSNKTEPGRPKIFVFAKPDPVTSKHQPSPQLNSNRERPDNKREQGDSGTTKSSTNSVNPISTVGSSKSPEKTDVKEELILASNQTAESSPKFRSITPTPQTSSAPSLSQQRRSKTPTPAMNKELMRTKQSIGQRRINDLKLKPMSATAGTRPANSNSGPMMAPPPIRPATAGYPYQYPFPAWGNSPGASPSFNPSSVPREYYEHFYRWLQYYASLSPEQQKSFLSFTPNGNPPPAPFNVPSSSSATATPAMQTAYAELLRSHLGKNLSNFTNSVSRASPQIKAANTNIYEASKPKPINKSKSSASIPSPQTTTHPTSLAVDQQSKLSSELRTKPYSGTTNEIVESSSRDNKQPMIEPQSNSFSNQAAGSNPAAHPSSRQGMLKWAGEGRNRVPESHVEIQNRLLQEYRNRPGPNKPNSSSLQYPPTAKVNPSMNSIRSEPSTAFGRNVLLGKADTKCALCGLVDVQSPGDYCSSCLVYLARLKPVNQSTRVAKKL